MIIKNFLKISVFFILTLISIAPTYAQENSKLSLFQIKDWHLMASGFGGLLRHFDMLYESHFDKSYFPAYGGGILFKMNDEFGFQFEGYYLNENNSSKWVDDGLNNTYQYSRTNNTFKCCTYVISANFFPFENTANTIIKPYFKIGFSRNDYSTHAEYFCDIKNESGELVDTQHIVFISESRDKHRYRNGLVLAVGANLSPDYFINLIMEMQYNSVYSDAYNGGVLLKGGIQFRLF